MPIVTRYDIFSNCWISGYYDKTAFVILGKIFV